MCLLVSFIYGFCMVGNSLFSADHCKAVAQRDLSSSLLPVLHLLPVRSPVSISSYFRSAIFSSFVWMSCCSYLSLRYRCLSISKPSKITTMSVVHGSILSPWPCSGLAAWPLATTAYVDYSIWSEVYTLAFLFLPVPVDLHYDPLLWCGLHFLQPFSRVVKSEV